MSAARSVPEDGNGQWPLILRICCAEFCRNKGSERLVERAEVLLGVKMDQTTADNRCTLQPAFCLGYCGQAPAVMLDGRACVRMSPQLLDQLIEAALRPDAS